MEARVVVQTYASLPDEVYMETETFLNEFDEYVVRDISNDDDDVLQLVMTEKDGVIFKAYAWTSELKERK